MYVNILIRAVFSLHDEIDIYKTGRYIGTNEAVWRILQFPIHKRYSTVVHLAVHVEDGQRICFDDNTILGCVSHPPTTTLTAFFVLCQQDSEAKKLLYNEVPMYYTWSKKENKWNINRRYWKSIHSTS
eukprot:GHVR01116167.1.p1 GENE.GHVR01116167.1~~GHVR01116167.1.p1  ORF type:complete len:128 (+),score=8.47 GHVR01116167.1:431-814(+)